MITSYTTLIASLSLPFSLVFALQFVRYYYIIILMMYLTLLIGVIELIFVKHALILYLVIFLIQCLKYVIIVAEPITAYPSQ